MVDLYDVSTYHSHLCEVFLWYRAKGHYPIHKNVQVCQIPNLPVTSKTRLAKESNSFRVGSTLDTTNREMKVDFVIVCKDIHRKGLSGPCSHDYDG